MSDVKNFLNSVKGNSDLTARVQNAGSPEELAAVAAAAGHNIPSSAFAGIQTTKSAQLSEAELAGVAGGRMAEKTADPTTSGVTKCCWTV
jgi:predicted ribosomally synthesized peptide with nif11-like leader